MTALFFEGNALSVLPGFPADYFHTVVTSPPFFGLRAYDSGQESWPDGWEGQLGAEPTPDLYIQHLILIMRGIRRVLRPDGVFWLNIGDSWSAKPGQRKSTDKAGTKQQSMRGSTAVGSRSPDGVKPLDMMLIPSLLALAAREDSWYVRSMAIWAKGVSFSDEYNGNPMPESVNGWRWELCRVKVGSLRVVRPDSHEEGVGDGRRGDDRGYTRLDGGGGPNLASSPSTEWLECPGCPKCSDNDGYVLRKGSWRPTDSYEFVLMLTKTGSYFCDREAVLEPGVYPSGESRSGGNGHKSLDSGSRTTEGLHNKEWVGNGGRNIRSVWAFPTAPGKFKHYAAFPPRLPEICIKAATSEKGCCPTCGSPWARVIDVSGETPRDRQNKLGSAGYAQGQPGGNAQGLDHSGGHGSNIRPRETVGWRPTCSCSRADPIPCRVLDPFSGAGTTALVAERLGVDSFNIDTSAEYIALSEERLADDEDKRVAAELKQIMRDAGVRPRRAAKK